MSEVKYKYCSKCGNVMTESSGGWWCSSCGSFETADGKIYPTRIIVDDVASHPTNSFDWQAFRAEAAKDILAGFASAVMKDDDIMAENTTKDMVNIAISWADELIRQLKDET